MYFLFFVFLTVLILTRFDFSISSPIDDLNSDPLLFDSTQSSSPFFADDNEVLTTDATLPNACSAAQNDLSLTPDQTNLFSRRDNIDDDDQCLPPVKIGTEPLIGTEALQLFESPLNSLQNLVLPPKGQTSDDPPQTGYPGLVGDDEKGSLDETGWKSYAGPVGVEQDDSSFCTEWTSPWGNYPIELCCDGQYMEYLPIAASDMAILARVDATTVKNRDFTRVYDCLGTPLCFCFFCFFSFVPAFVRRG